MKKRNVVIIVLLIALLLMGSAYALWTDSVTVEVTAQSATMDVQIVERTENITPPSGLSVITYLDAPVPATINAANPTSSVTEGIVNFIPGDVVTLTYKIENRGTIDVLLTGVNITYPGATQTLQSLTLLDWTLTEYVGGVATGDSISGSGHLGTITANTNASASNVGILANAATDYCLLTVEVQIDDPSGVPYSSVLETSFTVTPVFTQD
ncbi:MAG: hypothetical protein AB1Z23_06860 [Eubacteriales bacterium]